MSIELQSLLAAFYIELKTYLLRPALTQLSHNQQRLEKITEIRKQFTSAYEKVVSENRLSNMQSTWQECDRLISLLNNPWEDIDAVYKDIARPLLHEFWKIYKNIHEEKVAPPTLGLVEIRAFSQLITHCQSFDELTTVGKALMPLISKYKSIHLAWYNHSLLQAPNPTLKEVAERVKLAFKVRSFEILKSLEGMGEIFLTDTEAICLKADGLYSNYPNTKIGIKSYYQLAIEFNWQEAVIKFKKSLDIPWQANIESKKVSITTKRQAICIALQAGHENIIEEILRDPDVTAADLNEGIWWAIEHNDLSGVARLLQEGVCINREIFDTNHVSVLACAAGASDKIFTLILESADHPLKNVQQALWFAVHHGQLAKVVILSAITKSVELVGGNEKSLFATAVEQQQLDVIIYFLQNYSTYCQCPLSDQEAKGLSTLLTRLASIDRTQAKDRIMLLCDALVKAHVIWGVKSDAGSDLKEMIVRTVVEFAGNEILTSPAFHEFMTQEPFVAQHRLELILLLALDRNNKIAILALLPYMKTFNDRHFIFTQEGNLAGWSVDEEIAYLVGVHQRTHKKIAQVEACTKKRVFHWMWDQTNRLGPGDQPILRTLTAFLQRNYTLNSGALMISEWIAYYKNQFGINPLNQLYAQREEKTANSFNNHSAILVALSQIFNVDIYHLYDQFDNQNTFREQQAVQITVANPQTPRP